MISDVEGGGGSGGAEGSERVGRYREKRDEGHTNKNGLVLS